MTRNGKAPGFMWYPADWLSDGPARRLTMGQKGLYRELLDHQWLDGWVPTDERDLAHMVGVTVGEIRKLWRAVSQFFTPIDGHPDRLINGRMEEERQRQLARRASWAAGGRKGGLRSSQGCLKPASTDNSSKPASHPGSETEATLNPSVSVSVSGSTTTTPPNAASGAGGCTAPQGGAAPDEGEASGTTAAPPARKPKPKAKPYEPKHPKTLHLAAYLDAAIGHWKPDSLRHTDSRQSVAEMDRLLSKDKRDPALVEAVLDWLFGCEEGDYEPRGAFDWRPNIGSGRSLRRAWDKLETAYRAATDPNGRAKW